MPCQSSKKINHLHNQRQKDGANAEGRNNTTPSLALQQEPEPANPKYSTNRGHFQQSNQSRGSRSGHEPTAKNKNKRRKKGCVTVTAPYLAQALKEKRRTDARQQIRREHRLASGTEASEAYQQVRLLLN
jgi:hypothetical protein